MPSTLPRRPRRISNPLYMAGPLRMRLRAGNIPATAPCRLLYLLSSLCLLILHAAAQPDPIKNFCRRFGHQTAVLDGKLYVDGGLVNYNPMSQYPANYSNTGLLYHDLHVMGSGKMPQLYANLTKNSSIPSVHGGTLWTDEVNKRIYLFGGETFREPPSPYFNLWSFDPLQNQWVSFGPSQQGPINGVSYGAGASISQRGEGYYYGGWMSNSSVPGWSGPPVATSSLIKYDFDKNEWTNMTGPADSIRRAEGVMLFIPIGDDGMMVYFGGIQDRYQNGTVVGQPMDQIWLYDVLSSKWYSQTATGTVPEMRARFCAGATWAADQSSYNIYLYGGAGIPPDTAGFDDVYILTIPSFQWIKIYPDGNETGQYPHHSLSCNVIDNAQMMIIGGTFPLSTDCDVPDQFGTHNLDMGMQNPDKAAWQLFRPTDLTNYSVPDPIIRVVGGSGSGGATKKVPDRGFSNPDLKVLMTRKATFSVRTPTRKITSPTDPSNSDAKKSPLSAGAIAGISVGGAVAFVLALSTCIWCIIHRRRRRQALFNQKQPGPVVNGSLPPTTSDGWHPHSPTSPSFSPTSLPPSSPFLTTATQHYASRPPAELDAASGANIWHSSDGITYELSSSNGSPFGGAAESSTTGTGSTEMQTKVDSEGRVWVQVPTTMGGVGNSYTGPSPITPESALPPQELDTDEKREGGGWLGGGSGTGGRSGGHQTYYHP